MNYFEELSAVNCSDKIEKKNNLSYLSWAWAWAELKKRFPTAVYTVYENADGWCYHTDGKTAWVKTGVTVDVEGTMVEHIEYLPVMDYKNKSIPVEHITSFDVNKAIQRSLTKAVARHGLGLYIYAGEDLPEGEEPQKKEEPKKEFRKVETVPPCADCGKDIFPVQKKDGQTWAVKDMMVYSHEKFGRFLCGDCMKKANAKS